MARRRLIDPMTTVDGVSRKALGVDTQAEIDATAAELQRYRDTDDARREAPVVTGSTADGTALASVIAALTSKGVVVDATATVDNEVVTGSLVADELSATRADITTLVNKGQAEFDVALRVAYLAANINGTTTTVTVDDATKIKALTTIRIDSETMVVTAVSGTTLTVTRPFGGGSSHTAGASVYIDGSFYVMDNDGSFFFTVAYDKTKVWNALDVYGAVAVTGNATFNGNVTLGDATGDTATVTGALRPAYRISTASAPAATIAVQAAAGSTGTATAANYATDIAGSVEITPGGTGIAAGIMARVTFANGRGAGTNFAVQLTPSASAAALQPYATRNGAYLSIGVNVAPAAGTAFTIHYLIIDLA